MFENQAGWAKALMGMRDAIMSVFGVKTASEMQRMPQGSSIARVGFFRIYSKSDKEIVLGEDDSHLDFRLSVLIRHTNVHAPGAELVITTVVHCHNLLGRTYLAVIKPFHKLIVRTTLNRAARSGWPKAACAASA